MDILPIKLSSNQPSGTCNDMSTESGRSSIGDESGHHKHCEILQVSKASKIVNARMDSSRDPLQWPVRFGVPPQKAVVLAAETVTKDAN